MTGPAVLIAGAGYTGDRLAAALVQDGRRVALLSRQPAAHTGATPIPENLDAPVMDGRLNAWLQGEPVALVYLVPPDSDDDATEDRRLRRLLQALGSTPERVVLASTSGVYGDRGGRLTPESTPVNPQTTRAKRRVRLEQTLAQSDVTSTVVLRISGIYGPGRLPLDSIRRGDPIIDPDEAGPGNRIHVDDLVAICTAALDHPAPPAVVNVADGDHTSSSDFTLAVADIVGLTPPERISRADAQQRLSPGRLSFLNESRLLDTHVLREALGVTPAYTCHRDGIAASLRPD
ncbi:MAG: NAD-dependent epimerase/dehydratase family protein [Pseudomonadota bacterium]